MYCYYLNLFRVKKILEKRQNESINFLAFAEIPLKKRRKSKNKSIPISGDNEKTPHASHDTPTPISPRANPPTRTSPRPNAPVSPRGDQYVSPRGLSLPFAHTFETGNALYHLLLFIVTVTTIVLKSSLI